MSIFPRPLFRHAAMVGESMALQSNVAAQTAVPKTFARDGLSPHVSAAFPTANARPKESAVFGTQLRPRDRLLRHEEWTIGADGLIAESKGHYDEAEYQRQLNFGAASALTP